MDGIRKMIELIMKMGDLQHLQNIDIVTSDRREKIETMKKEVDELRNAFFRTKQENHEECYFQLADCYNRLQRLINDENFNLRIFNRFKNDPIDDLEKFNISLMTFETEMDTLLFPDRVEYLHYGDLIVYHCRPSNDDKILQVRHIRKVRGGFNVIVANKNGEEIKLNKYQLSNCHRIISHKFRGNVEAMQKLDRGCLLERLLDITMSKFF